jgi:glyoxylase-like metal-dependent hydrolase (beta-lactamase superfamily II)
MSLLEMPRRLFSRALFAISIAAVLIAAEQSGADPVLGSEGQVPGYYRMAVGNFELTALFDGRVGLDPRLFRGLKEADLQARLESMHVPLSAQGVQAAVNAFLINTGSNLVLVDAGAADCFGPASGAMLENLQQAGYRPEQVDTILLTHLHGDHACGLAGPEGTALFPNATLYVPKEEAGFWLSEDIAAKAPDDLKPFFTMARNAVSPYIKAGQFKAFPTGEKILEGVEFVPLLGHTPGHGGYLFSSAEQALLVWGDVVHSHAIQFAFPEVSIEFDVDRQQAIATRKAILAEAVKSKLWIAGAHLPFPGVGHVRADEAGYDWVPAEYAPYTPPPAVGHTQRLP